MGYKVEIESGKGKNFTRMGSIELLTKADVSRYIKRNPINNRASTRVIDTISGKTISGRKLKFFNPDRW